MWALTISREGDFTTFWGACSNAQSPSKERFSEWAFCVSVFSKFRLSASILLTSTLKIFVCNDKSPCQPPLLKGSRHSSLSLSSKERCSCSPITLSPSLGPPQSFHAFHDWGVDTAPTPDVASLGLSRARITFPDLLAMLFLILPRTHCPWPQGHSSWTACCPAGPTGPCPQSCFPQVSPSLCWHLGLFLP